MTLSAGSKEADCTPRKSCVAARKHSPVINFRVTPFQRERRGPDNPNAGHRTCVISLRHYGGLSGTKKKRFARSRSLTPSLGFCLTVILETALAQSLDLSLSRPISLTPPRRRTRCAFFIHVTRLGRSGGLERSAKKVRTPKTRGEC